MQTLQELYTPGAVDTFIDTVICRHMPATFQQELKARWPNVTKEEREACAKVDAVCKALERRDELTHEIATGLRDPADGCITRGV